MHRNTIRKGLRAILAGGVAISLMVPALADPVYRWTDRDGRVNYGNMPPPGVKAELLDRGTVSVTPAPAVPSRPPAASPESALPETARRLDRLEAELEDERRLRRDAEERATEEASRLQRTRAECEERFREPCDDEGRPMGPRYIVVPPRPAWLPHGARPPHRPGDGRPPHARPGQPVGPRSEDMPKPVLPIKPERSSQVPARPYRGQPVYRPE